MAVATELGELILRLKGVVIVGGSLRSGSVARVSPWEKNVC